MGPGAHVLGADVPLEVAGVCEHLGGQTPLLAPLWAQFWPLGRGGGGGGRVSPLLCPLRRAWPGGVSAVAVTRWTARGELPLSARLSPQR